uniref:SWIM-type domain-containing protein n=1 Tax=Rhabditophanes sp. KR3021 TaxID=114890 RepID=A0AC35U0B1_9BILA
MRRSTRRPKPTAKVAKSKDDREPVDDETFSHQNIGLKEEEELIHALDIDNSTPNFASIEEEQIDVEGVEENINSCLDNARQNDNFDHGNNDLLDSQHEDHQSEMNGEMTLLEDVQEGQLVEQTLILGTEALTIHMKIVDHKRVVYLPNRVEKLGYDDYMNLLRLAEHTPDIICRDPPFVHMDGSCIVIYDCSDIEKDGVLTDQDVRSTLRIDGYRWSCSRGTRSLCNGLKRGFVNLYSPDNRGGDESFSRYEIWDSKKPNGVVLFHYIGDHKKAIEVAQMMPHRNSKKSKPFLRTQPRLLRKIARSFTSVTKPDDLYKQMEINNEFESNDMHGLRGVQQVKNVIRYFKRKARLSSDGVYNIYLMEQLLRYRSKQSFVHEIVLPSINITLYCAPLLSEFTTCHKMPTIKAARLFYERVPTGGPFKISVLSFKHPFFIDEPLIPLAFRIYEDENNEVGHVQFLQKIMLDYPDVEEHKKILISDFEFNYESNSPNLKVFKNWKNIKAMVTNHFEYEKTAEFDESINAALNRLLYCDSKELLTQEWNLLKDAFTIKDQFNEIKLFEETVIPQIISYYACLREKVFDLSVDEVSDLLNKPPTLSEALYTMYNTQELPIDINMLALFYFCNVFIREVCSSYQQAGGTLRLNPIFDEVIASGDLLEESPHYVPIHLILDNVYRDASNNTTFLVGTPWQADRDQLLDNDPDYAFTKTLAVDSIAQRIIDDKSVTIESPGQFRVVYKEESFMVHLGLNKSKMKFTCVCSASRECVHIKAVKMLLNVVGHSDDKLPSVEEERKKHITGANNHGSYTKRRRLEESPAE